MMRGAGCKGKKGEWKIVNGEWGQGVGEAVTRMISPHVGEMPGRAEGGVKEYGARHRPARSIYNAFPLTASLTAALPLGSAPIPPK